MRSARGCRCNARECMHIARVCMRVCMRGTRDGQGKLGENLGDIEENNRTKKLT